MIILTTVTLHKLSNAYITNICINDNNCRKFLQEPPYTLPINTTTVHFEDVPIAILNNTFTNKNIQSITWISSNITSVAAVNYSDLQYLNLSNNNIEEIYEDAFEQCYKLEYIDLSENKLSVLSDKLFQHTILLEYINLKNNFLYSISEHLFKETSNLKNISLGNHNLSILAVNALSNLDKLEYLSIENSGIKSLNKSTFGQHNHLKSILLNNCTHLTTIENDLLSSIPNIEIIELNNCGFIHFLPHSIAFLKNLRRLEMSKTQVQPNCHNGWFSQWNNNDTINDIGFENYNYFIKKTSQLKCPAKIYYISDSITLHLTKKGIINCKAFGNPLPAITWLVPSGLTFHENKEADDKISHHPNIHNWDLNRIDSQSLSIDKNGSLHILRMLRTSIGNYTCYVSNEYGNDSKVVEVHLDSGVFFSIKINALLLGIISALGFLGLTILCCSFKLLLIRLVL